MKKFLLGVVAAVVIGLGVAASDASAHWESRVVQRWDPCLGAYVVTPQQVWVPDDGVVACPPVVVPPPIVVHRGYYHGHHEHHEHHGHHGHWGHR